MSDISRNELYEKLENLIEKPDRKNNIAILWDVENVTPSADSLFINGLIEYINYYGTLRYGRVYGDWTKRSINKLAPDLTQNHFQLFHTPISKKNSSDMQMVADGIDLAINAPYLNMFVLLTGDADFRPLISSLVRSGKKVHIICDVKTASEDLLSLVEEFRDYRELLPGGNESNNEDLAGKKETEIGKNKDVPLESWFEKLKESIISLEMERKETQLGIVKVKMKMLNPEFDEKQLGFNRWSKFVNKAVDEGFVEIKEGEGGGVLKIKGNLSATLTSKEYFDKIIELLDKITGRKKKFVEFAQLGTELRKSGITPEQYGFRKFKHMFQAAEKRNFVETKAEGFQHYIRKV